MLFVASMPPDPSMGPAVVVLINVDGAPHGVADVELNGARVVVIEGGIIIPPVNR